MSELPVYLDHHATTPVDPRVLESMLPWFSERFGNAASINHAFGREAAEAVRSARESIAGLIGADPRSLVFTSGATEANNLALKGAIAAGDHLITNGAEHRAVLDPARKLERRGARLTMLPVDGAGRVTAEQVADAIDADTKLVSVMLANNEIGTIQPIREIAEVCHARGVLLHCDAVQGLGRIPVDVSALGADLMSLSAHKVYGPKGVGVLYVRRGSPRIRMDAQIDGGGHEQGLRSGTLPVPLIVGFGAACRFANDEMESDRERIRTLRDRLWGGLRAELDGVVLNGHEAERLAGNLNVSFERVDGDALMVGLKRIAVSSGSACTSNDPEPSHVLRAIGRTDALTRGSLRFGIGRFNTEADIDIAIDEVTVLVRRLRGV